MDYQDKIEEFLKWKGNIRYEESGRDPETIGRPF